MKYSIHSTILAIVVNLLTTTLNGGFSVLYICRIKRGGKTKMFKIVAVCVFVVLCAPAWGGNCNIGEYAKDDDCVACPGGYPYSVPNASGVPHNAQLKSKIWRQHILWRQYGL